MSKALHETSDGLRDAEAIQLLREGISWLPGDVELYLQLGDRLSSKMLTLPPTLHLPFAHSPPSTLHALHPPFHQECYLRKSMRRKRLSSTRASPRPPRHDSPLRLQLCCFFTASQHLLPFANPLHFDALPEFTRPRAGGRTFVQRRGPGKLLCPLAAGAQGLRVASPRAAARHRRQGTRGELHTGIEPPPSEEPDAVMAQRAQCLIKGAMPKKGHNA